MQRSMYFKWEFPVLASSVFDCNRVHLWIKASVGVSEGVTRSSVLFSSSVTVFWHGLNRPGEERGISFMFTVTF